MQSQLHHRRTKCALYPPWEGFLSPLWAAFLSLGNSVNYNLLKALKGHETSKKHFLAPVFTKVRAEPSLDPASNEGMHYPVTGQGENWTFVLDCHGVQGTSGTYEEAKGSQVRQSNRSGSQIVYFLATPDQSYFWLRQTKPYQNTTVLNKLLQPIYRLCLIGTSANRARYYPILLQCCDSLLQLCSREAAFGTHTWLHRSAATATAAAAPALKDTQGSSLKYRSARIGNEAKNEGLEQRRQSFLVAGI